MRQLIDLAPGTVIGGDFRVSHRLSEGGMGAVYVVEQISTRAQRALKLMHPQLTADPKLRQRFVQEARVGAGIDSDHVVKVLAAGIDTDTETPWLVMELLQGEDLGTHVERVGALEPAEVQRIFEQLCHAVGAAHAMSIVHRDLKPENIFLARSKIVGVPWIVKVLDFGIAKVASEAITADTATIGSPMWMAPEQGTRGAAIAAPTDVWSLGLIAYYLLTGSYFWQAARGDSVNTMVLLREILLDPIPLASQRAREVGRAESIPAGFDAWLARCLERDPALRFRDASELYRNLVAVLAPGNGAPVARPVARIVAEPAPVAGTVLDTGTPLSSARSAELPAAAARPGAGKAPRSAMSIAVALGALALVVVLAILLRRSPKDAPAQVIAATAEPPRAADSAVAPPAMSEVRETPPIASAVDLGATRPNVKPPAMHPAVPASAHPLASAMHAEVAAREPESGTFDRAAAVIGLEAAASAARSCKKSDDPSGEARVVVRFGPSGDVLNVRVEGPPFAGTTVGHCIVAQFRACHVPPYSGEPVVMHRKLFLE